MRNLLRALRVGFRTGLVVCFSFGSDSASFAQGEGRSKAGSGLAVTFTALNGDQATDVVVLPNVALYVVAGEPPTPFLPGGKFSAEWKGYIVVDMRDNYTFQAELNGNLKLEINGAAVLEASAKGTEPSKPTRLNKGTNAFKAHFTSPADGDAFLRLLWSSKEFAPEPIPLNALTHEITPELQKARQLRLGRELFVEYRCAKCHIVPKPGSVVPELSMDAPSFEGIGSRRNPDWMERWIRDPSALRPTAHMPKLLRGAKAKEESEAIAAFLASLKTGSARMEAKGLAGEQVEEGRKLFETLHCVACHNAPDSTDVDPKRIGLRPVREKFAAGSLVAFLQKPEEHYAWIRMPNFRLTVDEAAKLGAFLFSTADKPEEMAPRTDVTLIERGKTLVQSGGCLNCHSLKLENQFKAPMLADLSADKWMHGCLAEESTEGSKAPQFSFNAAEREALQAFAATDRASLARYVPMEFADRQSRLLNCRECHGKIDGFPPLDILGGKLKPEWSKAFIAGEVSYKPRPWIESRMPHFVPRAEGLAVGLAAQHGYPPKTPAEPPIDQEAARVGRKLVSASGGFFCVSCHAVGSFAAQQVFESNGINLACTGERILKPYYHRWLRSPLRIDPISKMPVYFDVESRSPLIDVYEGDGAKQIEAIWQYLRLGNKMPSPTEAQ